LKKLPKPLPSDSALCNRKKAPAPLRSSFPLLPSSQHTISHVSRRNAHTRRIVQNKFDLSAPREREPGCQNDIRAECTVIASKKPSGKRMAPGVPLGNLSGKKTKTLARCEQNREMWSSHARFSSTQHTRRRTAAPGSAYFTHTFSHLSTLQHTLRPLCTSYEPRRSAPGGLVETFLALSRRYSAG